MTTKRTLRELVDAYKSGELDRDDAIMILDNDEVFVYSVASDSEVFRSFPAKLLEDAMDLLDVPWDRA